MARPDSTPRHDGDCRAGLDTDAPAAGPPAPAPAPTPRPTGKRFSSSSPSDSRSRPMCDVEEEVPVRGRFPFATTCLPPTVPAPSEKVPRRIAWLAGCAASGGDAGDAGEWRFTPAVNGTPPAGDSGPISRAAESNFDPRLGERVGVSRVADGRSKGHSSPALHSTKISAPSSHGMTKSPFGSSMSLSGTSLKSPPVTRRECTRNSAPASPASCRARNAFAATSRGVSPTLAVKGTLESGSGWPSQGRAGTATNSSGHVSTNSAREPVRATTRLITGSPPPCHLTSASHAGGGTSSNAEYSLISPGRFSVPASSTRFMLTTGPGGPAPSFAKSRQRRIQSASIKYHESPTFSSDAAARSSSTIRCCSAPLGTPSSPSPRSLFMAASSSSNPSRAADSAGGSPAPLAASSDRSLSAPPVASIPSSTSSTPASRTSSRSMARSSAVVAICRAASRTDSKRHGRAMAIAAHVLGGSPSAHQRSRHQTKLAKTTRQTTRLSPNLCGTAAPSAPTSSRLSTRAKILRRLTA
mmetsp:Transcript_19377/g.68581  ORF Transcript_19377/g.68581 Transcript_19377/m.68581 type:complete len:526 (-) Transcript_19377:128-1705(-)